MKNLPENLDGQIQQAREIIKDYIGEETFIPDLLDVYSWPQTWGSTACGFGGIGGQAITGAQTLVVLYETEQDRLACVFHNGRFAYLTRFDNIREGFKNNRLPGQAEFEDNHENLYKKEVEV